MGNIIVGVIVFGIIAFIAARLIIKARRGGSCCGCGECAGCAKDS